MRPDALTLLVSLTIACGVSVMPMVARVEQRDQFLAHTVGNEIAVSRKICERLHRTDDGVDVYDQFATTCLCIDGNLTSDAAASLGNNGGTFTTVIEEAVSKLKPLTKQDPDEDGVFANIGWLLISQGQLEQAKLYARRAIDVYPYDGSYYMLLAIAEGVDQKDSKVEDLAEALSLSPRLILSPLWSGIQRNEPDVTDRAVRTADSRLSILFRQSNDPAVGERLARLRCRRDNSSHSGADIVQAISEQLPNLEGIWELAGEYAEMDHDYQRALRDYRRAAFLDPQDPLPHERSATALLAKDDIDSATSEMVTAWRLQNRLRTAHAVRALASYHLKFTLHNDLVPPDVQRQLSPVYSFREHFVDMANYYRASGHEEIANELETLSKSSGSIFVK